tara:strand:- start:52 stop:636 length:585 start_codon:yes stop_codon:yes gene_type:complete
MATPFKMKGSPMARNYGIGKASPLERVNKKADDQGRPIIPKNEAVVTPKKTTKKTTKSYSEAYKDADKKKYKTEADFTKAAKAYNTKKYGTTEPTREANKTVKSRAYSDVTDTKSGKAKLAKIQTVKRSNKVVTDKNNARVAGEQKVKSDAIKKGNTTATTKKRTKAGKLGVQIGNIFRKKNRKKNPHRTAIKK